MPDRQIIDETHVYTEKQREKLNQKLRKEATSNTFSHAMNWKAMQFKKDTVNVIQLTSSINT